MKNKIKKITSHAYNRAILDIVIFILVLVIPWWLSTCIIIGLIAYFPLYLEALFFSFLFDTLYTSRYAFPYIFLTFSAVLIIIVSLIRTRIRT